MLKKLAKIFSISFILNLIWEFAHSSLYVAYKSEEITNYILFRAAFWDAVIITLIAVAFVKIDLFKTRKWIIILVGIVIACLIEIFALNTGRWEYNSLMPIVPIVGVGLSPLVQLSITGFVTFLFLI
jgi:hypothetical protein